MHISAFTRAFARAFATNSAAHHGAETGTITCSAKRFPMLKGLGALTTILPFMSQAECTPQDAAIAAPMIAGGHQALLPGLA